MSDDMQGFDDLPPRIRSFLNRGVRFKYLSRDILAALAVADEDEVLRQLAEQDKARARRMPVAV